MRQNLGFTVIELLIVILLIAFLSGIGGLSYLSMRPTLRLNGAVQQLVGDLMVARMHAVNQNNKYKVFFLTTTQYKVLDDQDNDGVADTGEASKTKNIQDHYPDITISSTHDPSFSPKGSVDTVTTVTVSNTEGASKTVSIAITGRVKSG